MTDCKISALPVLDGEGRVVGIVSEADLVLKEEFRQGPPEGQLSRAAAGARRGPRRPAPPRWS